MSYDPTPEQQKIIDAYKTGRPLVIEAGAGTGKTSTLKMLAKATPGRSGVYLAYNKPIAEEASKSFPSDVECRTSHSFAHRAVGHRYRHRLNGPRIPARQTAVILGINEAARLDKDLAPLAPQQIARIVTSTVDRFSHSADVEVTGFHVPRINGLEAPAVHNELKKLIVPLARKAWEDINSVNGRLRFVHDYYLKMWSLTNPQLNADYVLLDEAQDSNPCVASVVMAQKNSQLILVGDRNQSIYGWRGATDAMQNFDGDRLYLSQSFRFGPAIADEANKWLTLLEAPLRLTGFDQIPSRVEPAAKPDAILCRSNAGAFSRVISSIESGHRTALVGGGNEIKRLAEAAVDLQAGRGTAHAELMAFTTWGEVLDYVENDSSGSDLKVLVNLIQDKGADVVIDIANRLTDERYADVVVSTAHKAKGREWGTVRIATDFREPKPDPETGEAVPPSREEMMLAYVAVTRAQNVLDRAGLDWVDGWVDAPAVAEAVAIVEAVSVVVSPVVEATAEETVECGHPACHGLHPTWDIAPAPAVKVPQQPIAAPVEDYTWPEPVPVGWSFERVMSEPRYSRPRRR